MDLVQNPLDGETRRCLDSHRRNHDNGNINRSKSSSCKLTKTIKSHMDSLELLLPQDNDDDHNAIITGNDIINKNEPPRPSFNMLWDIDLGDDYHDDDGSNSDDDDESIDIFHEEDVYLTKSRSNKKTDLCDKINSIGEESFNHHHQDSVDLLLGELERFVAAEEEIYSGDGINTTGNDDIKKNAIENDEQTEATADLTESSSSSFSRDDVDDDEDMLSYNSHVRTSLPRSRQFDEYCHVGHNETNDSPRVQDDDADNSAVKDDSQFLLGLTSKGSASTDSINSRSNSSSDDSSDDDDDTGASHTLILKTTGTTTATLLQDPVVEQQQQQQQRRRSIRFSVVEIREHAVIVGDHPQARDSCPITLDWPHAATYSLTLNEYENKKRFYGLRRSSSCGSIPSRQTNLKRLSLEARRQRVRETSRTPTVALREMELAVAMNRLQQSMDGINDFWRKIDGAANNNVRQEQHPKRHQQQQQQQQVLQEQAQKIREDGGGGGGGGKKATSNSKKASSKLQQVLAVGTKSPTTDTTTATPTPTKSTNTKSKKSSKQSSPAAASISSSSTKSKQTKRHKRVRKNSTNNSSSNRGNDNSKKEPPYAEVITWRRVNRAVF